MISSVWRVPLLEGGVPDVPGDERGDCAATLRVRRRRPRRAAFEPSLDLHGSLGLGRQCPRGVWVSLQHRIDDTTPRRRRPRGPTSDGSEHDNGERPRVASFARRRPAPRSRGQPMNYGAARAPRRGASRAPRACCLSAEVARGVPLSTVRLLLDRRPRSRAGRGARSRALPADDRLPPRWSAARSSGGRPGARDHARRRRRSPRAAASPRRRARRPTGTGTCICHHDGS